MITLAALKEIAPSRETRAYGNRRKLCQENLYYLSRVILGRDLEPCTCKGLNINMDGHEGVAVSIPGREHLGTHCRVTEFFIKKRTPIEGENWIDVFSGLDEIKNRLLLYPRNTYKSSIDIDDVVQFILCFSEIRVLFLPGDRKLGKEFLDGINGYFVRRGNETPLEYLFPEHFIDEKNKYEDDYTTPARKGASILQPTVSFSSLESSLGGHHYDVMKPDDAVTRDNTLNIDSCIKVRKNFYIDRPMLMNYGYCDAVGTVYDNEDLWADMQAKATAYEKKFGERTLKVLCEPAWRVKPEAQHKKEEDLEENDVVLLFPRQLPFKFLRKSLYDEPDSFATQYMLRTNKTGSVKITEEMIRARTLGWNQLPQKFKSYGQWDLAYSAKNGRDWTVGVHGHIDENGRLYVIDITRDRYPTGREIAFCIVDGIRRHGQELVRIEDSMGARWLESDMKMYSGQLGVGLPIQYVKVSNEKNAKEDRYRAIEVVMNSNRLYFSASISCYDAMMEELTTNTQKDDIRDAIALLLDILPRVAQPVDTPDDEAFTKVWEELRRKQGRDMMYGGISETIPEILPELMQSDTDKENVAVQDYFGIGGSGNR